MKSNKFYCIQVDKIIKSIRTRNLQILATEIFKVYSNISPSILSEIFLWCYINHNLGSNSEVAVPNIRSAFHGSNPNVSYLGPKIWDVLPLEMKELTSVDAFKKDIKDGKLKNCPCKLCKQCILNLAFIAVNLWAF